MQEALLTRIASLPPGVSSGAGDSTTGGAVGCSILAPFGFIGHEPFLKKKKITHTHTHLKAVVDALALVSAVMTMWFVSLC